ncbi:hypothetical protein [Actinomycetospora sp. TBRC 11914]|uniref:hypothetical protein n=1 Tax=Actinomycetospora sp. TBRC 11914 TaxID=2729387 RepID=UPI00145EB7A5|nr:hypothetical protein [Actinomycetospora sp. TBRC 11914]NMO93033.1 hypothetical protein [Actinomycetospora sp. TBRC 11914]
MEVLDAANGCSSLGRTGALRDRFRVVSLSFYVRSAVLQRLFGSDQLGLFGRLQPLVGRQG